jgi:hypothetical protein
MVKQDFSGIWHSVYHFKSPIAPGLFESNHDVKIHQKGEALIIASLPNEEKSYLFVRLRLDDRVATGTWEEHTSPVGDYKGEIYVGAAQFVLSLDGDMFDGMFLSVDKRAEVKSNYWQIVRKT